MTNFARNWWRKHDMDRDGKGCCLIVMLVMFAVFAAGCIAAGALVWALIS